MKTTLTKKLQNKKGFTLIEALIVVLIVGLLAAMGIAKLADSKKEAERTVGASIAADINTAVQRASLKGVSATVTNTTTLVSALVASDFLSAANGAKMVEFIADTTHGTWAMNTVSLGTTATFTPMTAAGVIPNTLEVAFSPAS